MSIRLDAPDFAKQSGVVDSMEDIFKALLYGFKRERLVILEDSPPS